MENKSDIVLTVDFYQIKAGRITRFSFDKVNNGANKHDRTICKFRIKLKSRGWGDTLHMPKPYIYIPDNVMQEIDRKALYDSHNFHTH